MWNLFLTLANFFYIFLVHVSLSEPRHLLGKALSEYSVYLFTCKGHVWI